VAGTDSGSAAEASSIGFVAFSPAGLLGGGPDGFTAVGGGGTGAGDSAAAAAGVFWSVDSSSTFRTVAPVESRGAACLSSGLGSTVFRPGSRTCVAPFSVLLRAAVLRARAPAFFVPEVLLAII